MTTAPVSGSVMCADGTGSTHAGVGTMRMSGGNVKFPSSSMTGSFVSGSLSAVGGTYPSSPSFGGNFGAPVSSSTTTLPSSSLSGSIGGSSNPTRGWPYHESGCRQRVPARFVPIHSPRPVASSGLPGRSHKPPSGSMTTTPSSDMLRTTAPFPNTARDSSMASNLSEPDLASDALPPEPAALGPETSGFFCATVRSDDTWTQSPDGVMYWTDIGGGGGGVSGVSYVGLPSESRTGLPDSSRSGVRVSSTPSSAPSSPAGSSGVGSGSGAGGSGARVIVMDAPISPASVAVSAPSAVAALNPSVTPPATTEVVPSGSTETIDPCRGYRRAYFPLNFSSRVSMPLYPTRSRNTSGIAGSVKGSGGGSSPSSYPIFNASGSSSSSSGSGSGSGSAASAAASSAAASSSSSVSIEDSARSRAASSSSAIRAASASAASLATSASSALRFDTASWYRSMYSRKSTARCSTYVVVSSVHGACSKVTSASSGAWYSRTSPRKSRLALL